MILCMIGREFRGIFGHEREDMLDEDGTVLIKARQRVRIDERFFQKMSKLYGDKQSPCQTFCLGRG